MNKMTFIGLIGLTVVACQSNTEGYQIKGNIEGAGNGVALSGEKNPQRVTR